MAHPQSHTLTRGSDAVGQYNKTTGHVWYTPLWHMVTSSLELLTQVQIGVWPRTQVEVQALVPAALLKLAHLLTQHVHELQIPARNSMISSSMVEGTRRRLLELHFQRVRLALLLCLYKLEERAHQSVGASLEKARAGYLGSLSQEYCDLVLLQSYINPGACPVLDLAATHPLIGNHRPVSSNIYTIGDCGRECKTESSAMMSYYSARPAAWILGTRDPGPEQAVPSRS